MTSNGEYSNVAPIRKYYTKPSYEFNLQWCHVIKICHSILSILITYDFSCNCIFAVRFAFTLPLLCRVRMVVVQRPIEPRRVAEGTRRSDLQRVPPSLLRSIRANLCESWWLRWNRLQRMLWRMHCEWGAALYRWLRNWSYRSHLQPCRTPIAMPHAHHLITSLTHLSQREWSSSTTFRHSTGPSLRWMTAHHAHKALGMPLPVRCVLCECLSPSSLSIALVYRHSQLFRSVRAHGALLECLGRRPECR